MEMMRGQGVTGSPPRARADKLIDMALLVMAIVPPAIVLTVYAMFLLNGHKPIGYPWQLVAYGGQSLMYLTMRNRRRRGTPTVWLAILSLWFVLTTISLVLFVQSSATMLALGIERAVTG